MTDTASAVHTVEHTEASAMPEVKWGWRRLYIFLVTAALLAPVYWVTYRTTDIETAKMIARYAMWLVGLYAMLYVAGSTSTDITGLVAAFRTTRKETITTGGAAVAADPAPAPEPPAAAVPDRPAWERP